MGRLFGTDGVRGIANDELTPELAFKIGRAGAYVLTGVGEDKPRILVGRDTRISGGVLECALVAGICSVGAEAVIAGVIPTPAIAHLVRSKGFDAGVMISASHNPFEHNGIKYFSGSGYKLSDETEERIEGIILDNAEEIKAPTGKDIGHITYDDSLVYDYIKFAESTCGVRLDGLAIAIDCANGASSVTAQKALEELGAEVFVINDKPNGININDNCGSTHIDGLKAFVAEKKADLGLAFDGDADRVLAVDENGELVDGDKIMAILALDMKERGCLKDNTVVATVMSNLGFFVMGSKHGLNIKRTKVGDRYVLEEMLKHNHLIGGEQSGHVILLEHNTTGDGLVTGIQLASVLKRSEKKTSELASVMHVYPQVLENANVKNELKNEENYMKFPEIRAAIEKLESEFKDSGRVLIRPSGTEPLVRVMIEGDDRELIARKAKELAKLFEEKLN
ncbi:MAG TPA: phosphoglucosamine mutase [Candidatus Monoglobus merdigallinarum]|uniref:Phosphoglucosamine mutase n=1 Tax=Candidatus Monoglobus merdigallinarum TaxID=2838698 RepID=A0A9D1TLF2_9FIRM|nr:phosphoglucosamine mutase [Candidatus Monoglobus merdigallinarum]